MPRLPQRATAALIGTILAVGIPTGFALAANENARHGVEVSTIAKTNVSGTGGHGAAVSAVAKPEAPPEAPDAAPATHPANHGADVSAVAKDHTLVGGDHNNHGGAVSTAAHKH